MIIHKTNMARTKILATLGPQTSSAETIKKLIKAGVDAVRFNMSHGNYDFFTELFENINSVCLELESPLATLIDLQGPKIRIGELIRPTISIETGEQIEITIDDIKGDEKIISTSYKQLIDDAQIDSPILINDGLIRLRIREKKKNSIVCDIENGGILSPRKGMNLPGIKLSTPSITEKDYRDLEFVIKHRVDYIALSFVRSSKDLIELREWLKDKKQNIPVIAKIEKKEAIDDFDSILKACEGIMIARGDLGVELSPQDVPFIQKQIIKKCNEEGKLVITATQMLESMIHSPIPTRAEASDVANAVWDGTDVVMLSGETSIGKFPVQTVQLMNEIILSSEKHPVNKSKLNFVIPDNLEENLFDSVFRGISETIKQINAQAVVVFTYKGRAAQRLSKYKPAAKIIAISNKFATMNSLCIRWGVASLFMDKIDKEQMAIEKAKELILNAGLVSEGDMVIFMAGTPFSEKSRVNWLRFEVM
ncbi:MAG: pyruvate kinase [Ignavibacteriae bacterium]|nr:MAG: pyruvate kinase [Ignavibacteriota bacterium]